MLLGGFDGLHIGHRRLVSHALSYSLPVGAMTIVGGKERGNLFTFLEREEIFRAAGVDFLFELPFEEIKSLTPQEFLSLLEREFFPRGYVCGEDFRFGKGALGNAQTLKEHTQVRVDCLPLVETDGQKVSATAVKNLLCLGETEKANALLGEPFFLIGKVEKDRQVGRRIGFPTANIPYPIGKYPLKEGVYETRVTVDGKEYRCITNFGARPTFEDEKVVTETYLDGFSGDLYGRELKVEFLRYLRPVQKFATADDLKAQLTKDIKRVRDHD